MKILVFIKQVPATMAVEMDSETGALKRTGHKGKLNPFDLFAIEAALELRTRFGGTITTVSMGPMAAKDSLLETIYMGIDDAYLVSDPAFAGSDVLATSRALSQAVKTIGNFDLIICGKQTTDGDTAQVGAEIAQLLGIPHMNNVVSIEKIESSKIVLTSETEESRMLLEMPLPCLICVDKEVNTPRLPSFLRKKQYEDREIKVLSLKDFKESDEMLYGFNGSPTKVVRTFEPDEVKVNERIEGSSDEVAKRLFLALREEKLV